MKRLIKKFNIIVEKPVFWVALLILITSVVFIPALKMKFWWVDDGWDIMTAQKIFDSIIHLNLGGLNIIFDESGGRFRIMYWLYRTFEYLVGGTNPTLHFLVHYLVILLSVILLFKVVVRLTKFNLSAFVSSVLFVLIPVNTENLFRLGPQEPILCLFLIASIYFLLEDKLFSSILFLLLTVLTKENGFIIWIPVFCFYIGKTILLKNRDKTLEKYCVWGSIFSILPILNMFLRHGGYSGAYSFNPSQMIGNFKSYIVLINEAFSPPLLLFLATFIIRSVIYFRNDKYKKYRLGILLQAMFIILFLALIVVQSPWGFVLNRYVMPATIGLTIFIGMEIAGIKDFLQIKKVRWAPWLAAIFAVYLVSFIWVNMMHTYLSGELSVHQTQFIQSLYKDLAKEVPQDGVVLFNFHKGDSTMELVIETQIHLDLFYQRPDIKVDYLNLDNLPKGKFIIVGTPQIVEEYPRQTVEKGIGSYRKDEGLIQGDKYLVLTTPVNLFKQSIKKVYQLIVHKKPLTTDGIYTFYVSQDYWYKYYIGK